MGRKTLRTEGAVVCENFLSASDANDLRLLVDNIYEIMTATKVFPHPGMEDNFKRWNGVWLEPMPEFLAGTDLLPQYNKMIERITKTVHRSFGFDLRLYPQRSFFRRHLGAATAVPWHIDADAVSTSLKDCFNVWIPLDPVGDIRPSLEIVPGSHLVTRNEPLRSGAEQHRDDNYVASIGSTISPRLNLGDALAFDQFTLHRTQSLPPSGLTRTACEFRFEVAANLRERLGMLRRRAIHSFYPR